MFVVGGNCLSVVGMSLLMVWSGDEVWTVRASESGSESESEEPEEDVSSPVSAAFAAFS